MEAVLQGAVLGFSIAAPVGPIGVLVLRRSIDGGRKAGFLCGLGAATADLCYGAAAAYGVTALSAWQRPTSIIGGILLLYLAWSTYRSSPGEKAASSSGFAGTFALTLANPMTILSFAALVASAGTASPAWFIAGVFLGSLAWWALLSSAAALIPARRATLVWVNRLAALVLAGFGLAALLRAA